MHRSNIPNLTFLTVALALLTGCTSDQNGPDTLKLFAFDCGRINFDSIEQMGLADHETDVRDLIVPCYVIEHPGGRLLWEGGFASSYAATPGWHEMEGGWRLRLDKTFAEQLHDLGWSMDSFDYAAFSHFHFDHVGIANEVAGAELIIQQAEYDDAFADSVVVPGFDPSLYDNFSITDIIVASGEYDVFGDGRVRLIPTPGHTAGHQVLFVDLANTGPVVLSGDLHIFKKGYELGRIPSFNADSTQTAVSMARVENLLTETGAELWIGHELAKFYQLNKPPHFHD